MKTYEVKNPYEISAVYQKSPLRGSLLLLCTPGLVCPAPIFVPGSNQGHCVRMVTVRKEKRCWGGDHLSRPTIARGLERRGMRYLGTKADSAHPNPPCFTKSLPPSTFPNVWSVCQFYLTRSTRTRKVLGPGSRGVALPLLRAGLVSVTLVLRRLSSINDGLCAAAAGVTRMAFPVIERTTTVDSIKEQAKVTCPELVEGSPDVPPRTKTSLYRAITQRADLYFLMKTPGRQDFYPSVKRGFPLPAGGG